VVSTFLDDQEGKGRYWAADRARQCLHGWLDLPIVIAVKIKKTDYGALKKIDFTQPAMVPYWQPFVKACRNRLRNYGYAGVIIGPVSNGNAAYPEVHPAIDIPQCKFEASGISCLKFAYVYIASQVTAAGL